MNEDDSINPVFRASNGVYYTKQLFYEFADSDKSYVLYTLKDQDYMGYPSLRRLYMEMDDQSEYQFANRYFAGWSHWKKLLRCPWFADYITEFREELQIRSSAAYLTSIRLKALEGNLAANKYLLEQGWKDSKDKVGRPSKEKIKQEADKLFRDSSDISDDLERIKAGMSFQ